MEITSLHYLLFVLAFLVGFILLPKQTKPLWILSFSLFFYGSYSLWLLLALTTSVCFNYWITFSSLKRKKWISIIFNLVLLSIFKFQSNGVLIPIGISFFTFQALSFNFDYHNSSKVKFVTFANYLSFFPQLIAGPIETYDHLGNQLLHSKFTPDNIFPGLHLILKGLLFKLVLADRCGVISDSFYHNISNYDGWGLIFANTLFTFQIFLDFSGYCLIALGISKLINIDLSSNFHQPYKATSLSQFWRNWHSTLHLWFKKYVYFSFPKSKWFLALLTVFSLSGLWHGLKFHYLVWGIVCFLFYLFDKVLLQKIKLKIINWFTTIFLVFISWIFFRIEDISDLSTLVDLSWNLSGIRHFLGDLYHVISQEFWINLSSNIQYNSMAINLSYLDFFILTIGLALLTIKSVFNLSLKSPFVKSIILFILLCLFGFQSDSSFIYLQF